MDDLVGVLRRTGAISYGVKAEESLFWQAADKIRNLEKRIAELEAENARLRAALKRIRDCDWVITLPDRMDAVRDIARKALRGEEG